MKSIIDECLPKRMTQFFPEAVSNRFSDLLHSKDELVEVLKSVTSGNVIHISA